MNWGKGITIVIILFMGFIASFVYRAFQRDADLVREDYYEYEVQYDDNKSFRKNYRQLGQSLQIEKIEEGVCFTFPSANQMVKNGKINFYRADNKSYDRNFEVQLNEENKQVLPYDNFREGAYEISVRWEDGKTTYLMEENIQF